MPLGLKCQVPGRHSEELIRGVGDSHVGHDPSPSHKREDLLQFQGDVKRMPTVFSEIFGRKWMGKQSYLCKSASGGRG